MMISIITALLNENINYKLRKINNLFIKYDDIQYEDGIFEILYSEKNIDYIILNNKIIENGNIENTIKKIIKINNNIKFIIIDEENANIIEKSKYKNIIEIIFLNDNESEEILLNKIIEIIKKEENINLNNIYINTKKHKENEEEINDESKGKTIIFIGVEGAGKTLISAIMADKLSKDKKVLLIDMNFYNNDFKLLFKINNNTTNNNEEVLKIKKNLDLITDMKYKIKYKKDLFNKKINRYKNIYDFIIIDLKGNREELFLKQFLEKNDDLILLIEPNLINIKRTRNKYRKIINKNKKIIIIINKTNKYSINKKIIKKLICSNIIGEIKYNDLFEKLINNCINKKNYSKIKDLEKIIKEI